MDVDAVNVGQGLAIMSDGSLIPIVGHIGADGEECDKHEAVFCIAGPDANGKWWALALSEYTRKSH